jgi:hypothetical protein
MAGACFDTIAKVASPTLPALALTVLLAACSKSPAEPDSAPARVATGPAVTPLLWDKPASWTALPAPPTGPKKATYRIAKSGSDKEDAEVNVFFFGTGSGGDPEKNFKEWFDQFDGDAEGAAKRDSFEAHGLTIETVEVSGNYKLPLGPPVLPGKKSAMQMVKNGWRLAGAVVKTPDRGNWFFKLTGPDETVQSARSAFRSVLASAH